MKRVFLATRPGLIYRVVHEWYDSALNAFDNNPIVAFNEQTGCFEPAVEMRESTVFLVNDKIGGNVLPAFSPAEEDYLIYHEATRNNDIVGRFLAGNVIASSHEDDPEISCYAKVFAIIRGKGVDNYADEIVEAVFPSKRHIISFLSRLNDDKSPNLPIELENLQKEYDSLLAAGDSRDALADQWHTFVDHCLVIYKAL